MRGTAVRSVSPHGVPVDSRHGLLHMCSWQHQIYHNSVHISLNWLSNRDLSADPTVSSMLAACLRQACAEGLAGVLCLAEAGHATPLQHLVASAACAPLLGAAAQAVCWPGCQQVPFVHVSTTGISTIATATTHRGSSFVDSSTGWGSRTRRSASVVGGHERSAPARGFAGAARRSRGRPRKDEAHDAAGREGAGGVHSLDSPQVLELADALGASPQDTARMAARMAARWPHLLARDPAELAEAAAALQALLGYESRDTFVRRVLARHPQLVSLDPAGIEATIDKVAAGSGLTRDTVLVMCRRQPSLIYTRASTTLSKLAALQRLLGISAERAARIAVLHAGVLALSAGAVAARVDALAALLGVPRERAAKLCTYNASLLLVPPARLAETKAAWEAAAAGTGHARDYEAAPYLLITNPASVLPRWRLLQRLAPRHAPWAAWMARAGGAGGVLQAAAHTWRRAEYLAEALERQAAGAAGVLQGAPDSFHRLLNAWSDEQFSEWQPGFAAWLAERKAAVAAAEAAAGQEAVTSLAGARRTGTRH